MIRIHSRLLMAAFKDPLVDIAEEQADALILLVEELTHANPLAIAALDMANAILRARCSECAAEPTGPSRGPVTS